MAKRFFILFLPLLVFVVGLTAPTGEYIFRAGPVADAGPGVVPPYVSWRGDLVQLYSSRYAVWGYPGLVKVEIFQPVSVAVRSDCGFVPPLTLAGPGLRAVDVDVPPGFAGECWLNLTAPGWRWAVRLQVRPTDWWPSATRAVVRLNGSGWQFLQVGADGTLYIWERPVARLPLAGCVAVYNGSVLMAELLGYAPADPSVSPPRPIPTASGGQPRYGFLLRLDGTATVYIYPSPCLEAGSAAARPPPDPSAHTYGLRRPAGAGYVYDAPSFNASSISTRLRSLVVANGTASLYRIYSYWYGAPVDMWGGVLYYSFKAEPLLTVDLSLFVPANATGPEEVGPGLWLYRAGRWRIFVAGPEAPLQRLAVPRGLPYGWLEPFYIVADGTGQWGGWPTALSVGLERLP